MIAMVLAAVDDLMFSSKIRSTARPLGIDVVFARSRDEILAAARDKRPTVAIFDLNSTRTDPLGTIAALKADPGLAATRTIAFVSHVRADLVAAARAAGADEVMARSAFAADLTGILTASRDRS